jgi:hypothetical protein
MNSEGHGLIQKSNFMMTMEKPLNNNAIDETNSLLEHSGFPGYVLIEKWPFVIAVSECKYLVITIPTGKIHRAKEFQNRCMMISFPHSINLSIMERIILLPLA